MTKEALEALQEIKEKACTDAAMASRFALVERELHRAERFEDAYDELIESNDISKSQKIKRLMAFGIIKSKGELFHTADESNDHYYLERIYLTQAEYICMKRGMKDEGF